MIQFSFSSLIISRLLKYWNESLITIDFFSVISYRTCIFLLLYHLVWLSSWTRDGLTGQSIPVGDEFSLKFWPNYLEGNRNTRGGRHWVVWNSWNDMSDGEAAAGKKDESQFIRPKLKATRARVFACILALFGALAVGIQVGDPSNLSSYRAIELVHHHHPI